MWRTINRTARSRHLHAILLAATLLLGLSLQNENGGNICEDQVVWFDKALVVAQKASELLKSFNPRHKFPALLEDTRLLGLENQLLFMVPFRLYDSMHVAGKTGRDRVVVDTFGNFVGVIFDVRNENSVLPVYKICRFFLINDPSHEVPVDDGYEITGYACKSNFVNAKAIRGIQNKCLAFKNLPDGLKKSLFFKRKECKVNKRGFLFTHIENRNYDLGHIRKMALYDVVLDPKCEFLRISRHSRDPSHKEACPATWTWKQLAPTIEDDSSSHLESTNLQGSEQFYTCRKFMFNITGIQNYVHYAINPLISNVTPMLKPELLMQEDNLLLWPMILPERRGPSRTNPLVFALAFDENHKFKGIYYASAKNYIGKSFKPCPDFYSLQSRLTIP